MPSCSRRTLLQSALASACALPAWAAAATSAAQPRPRILVVLELTGANDGLNTLVPHGDDAYYRLRPRLALPAMSLHKIDEHLGFAPTLAPFARLYRDGMMAVVHGVGYPQPSFSHFTSARFWHTGVPHAGEKYGWLGRVADAVDDQHLSGYMVNIAEKQSAAVQAARHIPVVFDEAQDLRQKGLFQSRGVLDRPLPSVGLNEVERQLVAVRNSALAMQALVQQAQRDFQSPFNYGLQPLGLPKIAALIAAQSPARLFYTSYRHNAFDTHVHQAGIHSRLLRYMGDAVSAFFQDMHRLGRAQDVVMLVISEFGRRAAENANLGTDHGTANHAYLIGAAVRGGHYGAMPSLTDLDDTDNLRFTTDYRRVYATLIEDWLGHADSAAILGQRFASLGALA